MSRQTARIEPMPGPEDRDGILVTTPYREGFVVDVKLLPWRDRQWWDSSKAWWVAAEHADHVERLLGTYFGGFERIDSDTGEITYHDADGDVVSQGGLFG